MEPNIRTGHSQNAFDTAPGSPHSRSGVSSGSFFVQGHPRTAFEPDDAILADNACRKVVCCAMAKCGLPVARMSDTTPMTEDPNGGDISNHIHIDTSPAKRLLVWNPEQGGTDGSEPRFNYWFVNSEGLLTSAIAKSRMKTPGNYGWYAIEINSQILSVQEELDQGLPTVKRALASIQNSIKVWLNAECGFHIHISPLKQKLDISVTRRMAALVLLMERPFLLKLCHPGRQKSWYTRPISVDSVIAVSASASSAARAASMNIPETNLLLTFRVKAKGRSSDETRIFRMLCAIFTEPDFKSLNKGLRLPKIGDGPSPDGGRCGMALSRFGTVEMRYPEASFDVDFISLWVDLSRRILALAAAPDDEYNKKLLELYDMATAKMELGWIHWLKAVGMEERADFCKRHIHRYGGNLKDLNKRDILPKVSDEPAK
ncbi:hypothetical protein G6O67_006004 [Ophiocordyceps sinensis]|uniref:Amidoligase enzyme n=1 Tax=Ophiocordyceps sinensis TaxID=72228 RepID=A0A8H4LXE0_9HYPO|nr:hypothetical protein G6O67_006004 [Ophiocordyceps sinensis]